MRKYILFIAVAGLLFTSCRPKEAHWVLIKDDPSLNVFIEDNSIKYVSGDLARAWFTFGFKEPKKSGSKAILKALSYDEIDCARRTIQIIQVTFYFTDGTSQLLSKKFGITGIKTGSPAESEYNYLCKKR